MKRKIQSGNGLYAIIENSQLVLVEHDGECEDYFFSDSDSWLYEMYKILKKADEYGCFDKLKNSVADDGYGVEKV